MNKILVLLALSIICTAAAVGQESLEGLSPTELADGERLYRIHCARCHGIDGGGGEGSNLKRARLKYAPDDEALLAVIDSGIAGTGMPAIWTLDDDQARRVAAYVRSLGRIEAAEMPGDPVRGADIYRSKGGCPACHIIGGHGTGIGPELTDIGDRRGLEYLRQSLMEPEATQSQTRGYQDYLTVRARTKDGRIEGLRINEDEFTLLVRDMSGVVHSLRKDELQEYEKVFTHSLMPGYGAVMNDSELDDVISYLMSLRSAP